MMGTEYSAHADSSAQWSDLLSGTHEKNLARARVDLIFLVTLAKMTFSVRGFSTRALFKTSRRTGTQCLCHKLGGGRLEVLG